MDQLQHVSMRSANVQNAAGAGQSTLGQNQTPIREPDSHVILGVLESEVMRAREIKGRLTRLVMNTRPSAFPPSPPDTQGSDDGPHLIQNGMLDRLQGLLDCLQEAQHRSEELLVIMERLI